MIRIRSHPRNRIEFMIAHDASSRARIHHAPHEIHRRQLFRTPIDQIADEGRRPRRMAVSPLGIGIAKMHKERNQFVVLAVYVAYDVKTHSSQLLATIAATSPA